MFDYIGGLNRLAKFGLAVLFFIVGVFFAANIPSMNFLSIPSTLCFWFGTNLLLYAFFMGFSNLSLQQKSQWTLLPGLIFLFIGGFSWIIGFKGGEYLVAYDVFTSIFLGVSIGCLTESFKADSQSKKKKEKS